MFLEYFNRDLFHYFTPIDGGLTATPDAIKQAYHRLAIKHHPDKNPDDPTAADRFKVAAAAYEVLGDERRRASYDAPPLDLISIVADVFR